MALLIGTLSACATTSGDVAFKEGDLALAVKQYERSANGGDAAAALKLGQLYADYAEGSGSNTSPVYWFGKACEMGSLAGCHQAGLSYEEGNNGVLRDPAKAFEYFSVAAKQGYMQSQYKVGSLIATNQVRTATPVDGYKWLLIARDRAGAGFEDEKARETVLTDADGYMKRLEDELTPEQRRQAQQEKRAWRPEK